MSGFWARLPQSSLWPIGAGVNILTSIFENVAFRVRLNSQVSYAPELTSLCCNAFFGDSPVRITQRPPQILFSLLPSLGCVPSSGSFPLLLSFHFSFTQLLDSELKQVVRFALHLKVSVKKKRCLFQKNQHLLLQRRHFL